MATGTNLTLVLTGPESTGKTTLAEQLAQHFKAPIVAEAARQLMTPGEDYSVTLLTEIAKEQQKNERALREVTEGLLICDTDITVIYIWSKVKFGRVDAHLNKQTIEQVNNDVNRFYLLLRPDLPWEPDPLRESRDQGEILFSRYAELLDTMGANYAVVDGVGDMRRESAINQVNRWREKFS